ncbi:MAG: C40 family peptidase [Bacteroidales bacterium]
MAENREKTGVSLQGFIPVRNEPSGSAEMVTQILFGELFGIIEENGSWVLIKTLDDGYQGWVDRKCIVPNVHPVSSPIMFLLENFRIRNITDGQYVLLPLGSSIPLPEHEKFTLAGVEFHMDDSSKLHRPGDKPGEEYFQTLLSIPYLWGGRCGYGFDCSGLTQFLCRLAGKQIPRDATDQSALGETLSFLNEAVTGDLAFFDNHEGMINHVGMLIGNGHIIHASGTVRIDRIDQQGIFNEKIGDYTHKLRVLKRV